MKNLRIYTNIQLTQTLAGPVHQNVTECRRHWVNAELCASSNVLLISKHAPCIIIIIYLQIKGSFISNTSEC